MRLTLKDMLKRFGVDRELHSYETELLQVIDQKNAGHSVTAEIRMETVEEGFEFAVQEVDESKSPSLSLICQGSIALRNSTDPKKMIYEVEKADFKNQSFTNTKYNWDEKIARFFKACMRELGKNKIPDFEAIERVEMRDSEYWRKGDSEGGGRSPKINTNNLLHDMKRGAGM